MRNFLYFLSSIISFNALAFSLNEAELRFKTYGKLREQSLEVVNKLTSKEAVKFSIYKRVVDIDGNETLISENDNFKIDKTNLILDKISASKVNINWVGKDSIGDEQAYRLLATQVPVVLENSEHKGFMLQYSAALFVSDKNDYAQVRAEQALSIKTARNVVYEGTQSLEIILENNSSDVVKIANFSFFLNLKENPSYKFKINNVKSSRNLADIILPHATRRFVFDWPKDIPFAPLDAKLLWN